MACKPGDFSAGKRISLNHSPPASGISSVRHNMICIDSTFTRTYNLLNSVEALQTMRTLLIWCELQLSQPSANKPQQLWAGES